MLLKKKKKIFLKFKIKFNKSSLINSLKIYKNLINNKNKNIFKT